MLCCLEEELKSIEIILGSSSPRRKELLQNTGVQFSTISPDIEESLPLGHFKSIPEYIEALAQLKADAVMKTIVGSGQDRVVIGADTLVCFEGCVFGKPSSQSNAIDILNRLSGNIHQVITGVCLIWTVAGKQHKVDLFHEVTNVKMASLDCRTIEAYVQSGEPMDKAGAYGIQGLGSSLIEKIDGDYFNVVGLPVYRLCQYLRAGCKDINSLTHKDAEYS
uniref:Uncharacterized protein n=1 Tax=Trichobilharzia regenti TaxID=157069 RepID=A0AA85K9X1_TRIRE|nr:unnamed protein product [Trichobilharzia regenti]